MDLNDLNNIKLLIKSEIDRTTESFLNGDDKESVRFFLDSINGEIIEMIKAKFNIKQQLNIINKSTDRDIKYITYKKYLKDYLLKKSESEYLIDNLENVDTKKLPTKKTDKNEKEIVNIKKDNNRDVFIHEAVPNVSELY